MTVLSPDRSHSLDVMRGATLALMIIVNMSISEQLSFGPLLHATWHGLTLTDVVFPTFLFVVGAAFSINVERYRDLGSHLFLVKIVRRVSLIFLCGYLLYWFPFLTVDSGGAFTLKPFESTRILGVLQRIALCFGIAALLIYFVRERYIYGLSIIALLVYWWFMASQGDFTLQGNAALKVDLAILGASHLYAGEGIPFDPEGLAGTLPATVNVLAGYLAGRFLRKTGPSYETIAKLLMTGSVLILVALAWSSVFPLNKKLWTSSYTLCAIGIDLALLGFLVFMCDMKDGSRARYFFEVLGKNTLFIYLFAEILMSIGWLLKVNGNYLFFWLYETAFRPWAGDKPGSLLYSVTFMLGCWLVAYIMDRRRVYIKI
jgi:predicted acyltransferase